VLRAACVWMMTDFLYTSVTHTVTVSSQHQGTFSFCITDWRRELKDHSWWPGSSAFWNDRWIQSFPDTDSNIYMISLHCWRLCLQDGAVRQTVAGVQGPSLVQLITSMLTSTKAGDIWLHWAMCSICFDQGNYPRGRWNKWLSVSNNLLLARVLQQQLYMNCNNLERTCHLLHQFPPLRHVDCY